MKSASIQGLYKLIVNVQMVLHLVCSFNLVSSLQKKWWIHYFDFLACYHQLLHKQITESAQKYGDLREGIPQLQ